MTDSRSILFAMEGGVGVGLGHVARCRVLAEELVRRGHTVSAALRGPRGMLAGRGWPQSGAIIEADANEDRGADEAIRAFAEVLTPDWACIDGYGLTASGMAEEFRKRGIRRLLFEDLPGAVADDMADLIVNQSAAADPSSAPHRCQGPDFALVETAFPEIARTREPKEKVTRILVTLGGADPTGLARKVLGLLDRLAADGLVIDLVVGPYFEDRGPFSSRHPLTVHDAPPTLAPLMAETDLIICTASTSCWQACAAGLPIVAILSMDNQRAVARSLSDSRAAAVCPGDSLENDAEKFLTEIRRLIEDTEYRRDMARTAHGLVDGRGATRIADAMRL